MNKEGYNSVYRTKWDLNIACPKEKKNNVVLIVVQFFWPRHCHGLTNVLKKAFKYVDCIRHQNIKSKARSPVVLNFYIKLSRSSDSFPNDIDFLVSCKFMHLHAMKNGGHYSTIGTRKLFNRKHGCLRIHRYKITTASEIYP